MLQFIWHKKNDKAISVKGVLMRSIAICEPFLKGNEIKYINDAMHSNWISSQGKYVQKFEKAFSAYCGLPYGIGVCNGTAALHLAIRCLGIGTGDEIIIPSFTMISSAFAVCYTGAVPVFIDANPKTWNIDVSKIEMKITSKTKAIMAVHIYGLPCDMLAIQEIAKKHHLYVIEDASEAHGAMIQNKKVGTFSDIAAFSFYANKNITSGEGGMIVTKSKTLYKKAHFFKNLCFGLEKTRTYIHNNVGFNYRLSNIHAAIGLAQVEKANYYQQLHINHGNLYKDLLTSVPGITFQKYNQTVYTNVFWMNGIIIDCKQYGHTRNELIKILIKNGIETRLFFTGMHHQPALKKYGCNTSEEFPVADHLSKNGLLLPSGSGLTVLQIKFICKIIQKNSRGY